MSFAVDPKTQTVVVTEKADVDTIIALVRGEVPYAQAAYCFAEHLLGEKFDDNGGWAFGATTEEVAEYLRERCKPDGELVEVTVG